MSNSNTDDEQLYPIYLTKGEITWLIADRNIAKRHAHLHHMLCEAVGTKFGTAKTLDGIINERIKDLNHGS